MFLFLKDPDDIQVIGINGQLFNRRFCQGFGKCDHGRPGVQQNDIPLMDKLQCLFGDQLFFVIVDPFCEQSFPEKGRIHHRSAMCSGEQTCLFHFCQVAADRRAAHAKHFCELIDADAPLCFQ